MKNDIDRSNPEFVVIALSLAAVVFMAAFDADAGSRIAREPLSSSSPITSVTSDELNMNKWPGVDSVEDALQRLPQLSSQSTTTGSGGIRIRGIGSDVASTLLLVNGRRTSGAPNLNTIPAADIQRVEVLKDGASAVYGTETISGVINIITKTPQYEGPQSFSNPLASPFRGNPFQAGYRAMAAAEVDAVGQSLFGYYDAGGERGIGASAMFTSSVKLREFFGGGLCGGKNAPSWGTWPSRPAGECLADEMADLQSIYDTHNGITTSPQEKGDFVAYGLHGLGLGRDLAGEITSDRFPEWSGWGAGTIGANRDIGDLRFNPVLLDHILDYKPGGDHEMPARDDNILTFEFAFGEEVITIYVQEAVRPNDPLYKKPDTVARQVGGVLKKGFGALLGAGGIGAGTSNEDSQADDQWGLPAVGFTPMGSGTSAWDMVDGRDKNVVVAVIDSGLDLSHVDRPRFLWTNPGEIPGNGIDDDTNGYVDDIHGWNFLSESNAIDDDYGHGTFVAGIIAANTDNGEGIAGVNPGAQIMTLKVCDDDGRGDSLAVYRAIRYAVDNGARILNISLGRKGLSRLEQIGINYAYAMGCLVVVAAGNQGGDIADYGPPGARRVFSVASLNIDGTRRSQSNKGLTVAVAAPGESIYSLTAQNGKRDGRMIPILAGDYHRLNGTSFAAPFVSGTASLILVRYPHLSNRKVADLILAGATDAETLGWDPETGMGRLDARTALGMRSGAAFAPRITDYIFNRDSRGRIASVDVYGVIRGPLASYTLALGLGGDPDEDEWKQAHGPSGRIVDHGHIARLSGDLFHKGSRWSLRLDATSITGDRRIQVVALRKDS